MEGIVEGQSHGWMDEGMDDQEKDGWKNYGRNLNLTTHHKTSKILGT